MIKQLSNSSTIRDRVLGERFFLVRHEIEFLTMRIAEEATIRDWNPFSPMN